MGEKIEVLVDGGKASAGPPLGPALGPLGVNIMNVVKLINEKTAAFAGMKVPVVVDVDLKTKTFDVTVGTPPTTALIKKELGIESGGANQITDTAGDLTLEQAIKVSEMKKDSLLGADTAARVLEVAGTCRSMSVTIEGHRIAEFTRLLKTGEYAGRLA